MIVEFSGVPGSGKSTVIQKIKDESIFPQKSVFIDNNFSFLKDTFFIFYFFYIFQFQYKKLFSLIYHSENSFLQKMNLLRNVIKKISRYFFYNRKKEIYLFDEGVSHIVFNIFVDSSFKGIDKKEIEEVLQLLPLPNLLICIEADKEIVLQRLEYRGHKRINFDDKVKVENFVTKTFYTYEVLKAYVEKNINVIIIKNNGFDLNIDINSLKNKVKEMDV